MRVLISGAGIAGSTLAWFLAKAGKRVTIVEKSPSLLSHGQNVDIVGNAITIIKKMGLLDQVRQFNTKEQGTIFIDPLGQSFAPLPIKDGSTASFTSEFEILRADLAAILYNATKDLPNVTYLFDTTIKEVISNDDDCVKVELSNGEVHEFDLLGAADGQWSKMRKLCFPAGYTNVVDKGMYVGYWTIPRLPSDNNWWNIYHALDSKVITLRPDPHGTIRAMLSCMPCNDTQKKAWVEASKGGKKVQQELLRREFGNAGWQADRILGAMEQAPDFYFHTIQQVNMPKWYTSRVVFIGDAAYAPSPLTGQGTSLAILGGYILAGELSKIEEGENPIRALEAYDNTLRPFVEQVHKIPFFVPSIFHPRTAWKRWALQVLISTISKLAAIPWLVNRLPDSESNTDGFVLPHYPVFNDDSRCGGMYNLY